MVARHCYQLHVGEVVSKNWRDYSSVDAVWLEKIRCATNHDSM